MLDNITEIINEWDPIGLFPWAPEDEYECEIKKIYDYIRFDQNMTVDILAKKINEIFLHLKMRLVNLFLNNSNNVSEFAINRCWR